MTVSPSDLFVMMAAASGLGAMLGCMAVILISDAMQSLAVFLVEVLFHRRRKGRGTNADDGADTSGGRPGLVSGAAHLVPAHQVEAGDE